MTNPGDRQVPNPELEWLSALLRRVQSAKAAIPALDVPTSSIGPGPAWTGSRANTVHDNQLAPAARQFSMALGALEGDVQTKIAETPTTVSAGTARIMSMDYAYNR